VEIYDHILETLGNTPLVRLGRFHTGKSLLAAKVEYFNPGNSVKDRIGIALIEAGEREGKLKPGGIIVEPTSGNTGMGLAMAAALKGYRLICTAADKIPNEKVALLRAMGAEVITCPTHVPADDPPNPMAHYEATGPEIWRQTDGKITHWVAGIGTGGTISGTARFLKEQNPDIRVVGVDTVGSVYAYYKKHGELPPEDQIHQYLIDGIGEDFMPECVWWDYIDDVITVDDKTGYRATMELARKEGIFSGSSGGAAAEGARQVAADLPEGALVVTLLPDSGERYLSKLNDEWLRENGLLDGDD
jgi:cystathionine beta-synthase